MEFQLHRRIRQLTRDHFPIWSTTSPKDALQGSVATPAWRSKPSRYLVATEHRMIPPVAQRFMSQRAGASVAEVAGSHAVYVSQPHAVARLIAAAASAAVNMK